MTAVLVAVSGAFGAVARFGVGSVVQARATADVPLATAAVNLVGALGLGFALGAGASGDWLAVVGGFFAGLTTYSTWMVETVALLEEGRGLRTRALVNLVGLMAAGLVAAWVGLVVGRAV